MHDCFIKHFSHILFFLCTWVFGLQLSVHHLCCSVFTWPQEGAGALELQRQIPSAMGVLGTKSGSSSRTTPLTADPLLQCPEH